MTEKHWTDREIVWDLDRMKRAVESPVHVPPKGLSTAQFIKWAESKNSKDCTDSPAYEAN